MGGVEKLYPKEPDDAMRRIPDRLSECVGFLSVRAEGRLGSYDHFIGTAFFVEVDVSSHYLVTARHVLTDEDGEKWPEIRIRLNTRDGKSKVFPLPDDWTPHVNPAVDLAAMPYSRPSSEFNFEPIHINSFSFDTFRWQHVSAGDEVLTTGFFSHHWGYSKNVPILRAGIVAALPEEPFQDDSGDGEDARYYDAYLIETRSIGGLSGSPVFVVKVRDIEKIREDEAQYPHILAAYINKLLQQPLESVYLLGVIRSHWDLERQADKYDLEHKDASDEQEIENFNTGIAKVTPARDLHSLLMGDKFMKQREKDSAKGSQHKETLDSAVPKKRIHKPEEITQGGFEDALRRASRKTSEPKSENKAKRKR